MTSLCSRCANTHPAKRQADRTEYNRCSMGDGNIHLHKCKKYVPKHTIENALPPRQIDFWPLIRAQTLPELKKALKEATT